MRRHLGRTGQYCGQPSITTLHVKSGASELAVNQNTIHHQGFAEGLLLLVLIMWLATNQVLVGTRVESLFAGISNVLQTALVWPPALTVPLARVGPLLLTHSIPAHRHPTQLR